MDDSNVLASYVGFFAYLEFLLEFSHLTQNLVLVLERTILL